MRTYTLSTKSATCTDQHPSRSTKCAAFARAAVLAEFGSRDARALDQGDFTDRRPGDGPVLLGDVAAEAEDREAALKIAREIAGMIDVDWAGLFSGEATQ